MELRIQDPISIEVLDANSDDVLDAVEAHASDVALGPALALNPEERAIKLRFDVVAENDAAVYRQISRVVAVIEKHTDLSFVSSRSNVESHSDELEASTGEFAAC